MVQHQRTGYDSETAESTELVSPLQWRLLVAGLFLIIVLGAGLTVLLGDGLADPPRAPNLVIDLTSDVGLRPAPLPDSLSVSSLSRLPLTIEVSASSGDVSGWGIWLLSPLESAQFRKRPDGYFSTQAAGGWREFLHIRPTGNKLYLHIDAEGNGTFRINDEIAWTGSIPSLLLEWGIIHAFRTPINWNYIRLYAS
jgi:hypothetical protein